MTTDLVLATRNPGKLPELRELLGGLPYNVRSVSDFPEAREPEETGRTFWENALIKARAAHEATGLLVLADDSGLEVDALGGEPGVRSSRFSPEGTDEANIAELLRRLSDVPEGRRRARFRCAVCVVGPGLAEPLRAEGTVEGAIIRAPRGGHGFGYDPVFVPEGYDRTFAELGPEVKDAISHRAAALSQVCLLLAELAVRGPAPELDRPGGAR